MTLMMMTMIMLLMVVMAVVILNSHRVGVVSSLSMQTLVKYSTVHDDDINNAHTQLSKIITDNYHNDIHDHYVKQIFCVSIKSKGTSSRSALYESSLNETQCHL